MKGMTLSLALLVVAVLCLPQLAVGDIGTGVGVDVTANAYWVNTFSWGVTKEVVDPASQTLSLDVGEQGSATYEVTVTKGASTGTAAGVDGYITVTNEGVVPTEGLTLTVDLIWNNTNPKVTVCSGLAVSVASHPTLAPGESWTYYYNAPISSTYVGAGRTYKVTANAGITNHSGSGGPLYWVTSPSATSTLGSGAVDETVTVVDDAVDSEYGDLGTIALGTVGATTTFADYTRDFTYWSEGTYTVTNTASAVGRGTDGAVGVLASDSKTVTINVSDGANEQGENSYITITQGGWGATPNGGNPGAVLAANFASVYPNGVTLGNAGGYTLEFTSASAIEAFLPQGGTAGVLDANGTDPTSSAAGVFAGQVLALQLNVDFSKANLLGNDLSNGILQEGPLAGSTVGDVLYLANQVLGCGTSYLPAGVSLNDLNAVVTNINESWENPADPTGYVE